MQKKNYLLNTVGQGQARPMGQGPRARPGQARPMGQGQGPGQWAKGQARPYRNMSEHVVRCQNVCKTIKSHETTFNPMKKHDFWCKFIIFLGFLSIFGPNCSKVAPGAIFMKNRFEDTNRRRILWGIRIWNRILNSSSQIVVYNHNISLRNPILVQSKQFSKTPKIKQIKKNI